MIKLIAAVSQNGIIGKDLELPWSLPSDLKRFKSLTMMSDLIMGKNTALSLKRPLKGRNNIVLTSDKNNLPSGFIGVNTIEEALNKVNNNCFVIGGGQIYKSFLEMDLVDEIYLTTVRCNIISGNIKMPVFTNFSVNSYTLNIKETGDEYPYDIYHLQKSVIYEPITFNEIEEFISYLDKDNKLNIPKITNNEAWNNWYIEISNSVNTFLYEFSLRFGLRPIQIEEEIRLKQKYPFIFNWLKNNEVLNTEKLNHFFKFDLDLIFKPQWS